MKYYTLEEVATHTQAHDFWTVINNTVYDLSSFVAIHPGGPRILLNAAGNDSTVLFQQYHLFCLKQATAVLQKYEIGRLAQSETSSPVMGDFYHTCAQRVRDQLRRLPRRPTRGKALFCLDAMLMTVALLLGPLLWWYHYHNQEQQQQQPLWFLITCFLLHFLYPSLSTLRMNGQLHANGHAQIFTSPTTTYIAECYGYLLGLPGMFSYSLPSLHANPRTQSHADHRQQAQAEFPTNRGFAEHTALHHVHGAALEHDECFQQVTVMGLVQLAKEQQQPDHNNTVVQSISRWTRAHQDSRILQFVMNCFIEVLDCTRLVFVVPRWHYAMGHVWTYDTLRAVLIVVGSILPALAASATYTALPCLCQWTFLDNYCTIPGWVLYVGCACYKEYTGAFNIQAFFAQHVWDYWIPQELTRSDWGRCNALTTYSWWPTTRDCAVLSFLWTGKASPATLSYHLEHTLFPAVSYLHLPYIAETVRDTCREYNIPYAGLYSYQEVLAVRQAKLKQYRYNYTKKQI